MKPSDDNMRELIAFRSGDKQSRGGVGDIQPARDVSGMSGRDFAQGMIPIEDRMVCLTQLNALLGTLESEAA